MDTGTCASKCRDLSLNLMKKSDNVCIEEANGEVIDPSTTTREGNKEAFLGPMTLGANREIGEFSYNCNTPPKVVKKPQKIPHFGLQATIKQDSLASANHSNLKTPKDGIFDAFAPGPKDMVFAPICRKYIDEMRASVARCINFDYSVRNLDSVTRTTAAESISDEEMFESFYENLLEVIVSNQAEGFVAELPDIEWDSDGCKTPTSAPCLNGAAETCPGAPIKPTGRSRNIDLGLCRKLEF
ncbi:uncharacterized protein LOC111287572 [Durio zibethinus]|uniref:Uncharacterized protein LOC111287572 n=1 Tax=Durio zibethinus TaxID=66656 RepID=A0A6P5Y1Q2_DURZI|nr:uncharacterized protein LOC111287572 [Durio zibethinus]XP_022733936.1 uncharacterized protein LOC111287572 [Durio zibethinus]